MVEKESLADPKVKLTCVKGHKENFIECLRIRQKPLADVEIGARIAVTCHLVNFTYGEKILWDPAKLNFAEGCGKPEWLTRESRREWKV